MNSLAAIAARIAGRTLSTDPGPPPRSDESGAEKQPWRHSRRTKASFAINTLAIEKAVCVLQNSNVEFTQPLPDKLVIEPPRGISSASRVTYWPARERLQLKSRPTKHQQDLRAFEQALADQGHRIAGHSYRRPKSPALLRFERAQAQRMKRWVQQQTDLEEAQRAFDESMALHLQRLRDFAAGIRIGRRDPRLVDAQRRFRSSQRRVVRNGVRG